jgi:hypothetical protein
LTVQEPTPERWDRKQRGQGGRRGSCPPHGPIMVSASEEGHFVASCLACGFRGPEREDGWEAKVAFDEDVQPPPA